MTPNFQTTVIALWKALALGPPTFGPDQEVILTIDGLPLRLKDTPDEQCLLITGVAGQLAQESRTASNQVRILLQKGLGLLVSSRACISLLEEGSGVLTIVVQAIYPHRRGNIDILVQIIHELLLVLELSRSDLMTIKPLAPSRAVHDGLQESVVFRP